MAKWTFQVDVQYYRTEEIPKTRRSDGTTDSGYITVKDGEPVTETVELEIDLQGLVKVLGPKACKSKGGRAQEANGLVVCRKLKGKEGRAG